MGPKACRDLHMYLRCPFFLLYWNINWGIHWSLCSFADLCLKALWIKYLMCCVTVHAYVLDNNEINQLLMPTGSLSHKEYLSDKIHNTLSFSFLKCLQFCSWSQGCGWTIPIWVWKEECGKHSIKLELEAAAHDWQPETLLENQCSQGMHSSWKSSRQPWYTAASGEAEELQHGVSAFRPWEGKVEKASQGIGTFLQCNADCIHKLSISSPIQQTDQTCQGILSGMTPNSAIKDRAQTGL